ncbi:MAG: molybdopterin converting factor subunit 1 [Thermoplasmataceae archaeon]
MRLKIRYFGSASDDAGTAEETIEIPDGSGINSVHARVAEIHPAVGKRWSNLLIAVNQSYVSGDAALKNGDEIAIFPAVSGG